MLSWMFGRKQDKPKENNDLPLEESDEESDEESENETVMENSRKRPRPGSSSRVSFIQIYM